MPVAAEAVIDARDTPPGAVPVITSVRSPNPGERVSRRVRELLESGSSERVEITVDEAMWFVDVYDEWRRHDVPESRRPPLPLPHPGMTGTVFGYPCVVVTEDQMLVNAELRARRDTPRRWRAARSSVVVC